MSISNLPFVDEAEWLGQREHQRYLLLDFRLQGLDPLRQILRSN
jgi:hypothetical protein